MSPVSTGTDTQTVPPMAPIVKSPTLDPVGLAMALVGAFLFSTKPIFIKLLYADGVDAATQLMLRMGLSIPFYLAFAWYALAQRRRKGLATNFSRATLLEAIGVGLIGYWLASTFDLWGLQYITAQFERLILFTYPTIVALIGWWWFGERLTRPLLLALLFTYAGLALLFVTDLTSFGSQVVFGTTLVLASSVTYALYLVLSRRPIERMGSGLFTSLVMATSSMPILVQYLIVSDLSALALAPRDWLLAIGLAIVATVIPSFLISEAIARIGASATSVSGSSGPVTTTLLAVLILAEPFSIWHGLGMALVVAGVVILGRGR